MSVRDEDWAQFFHQVKRDLFEYHVVHLNHIGAAFDASVPTDYYELLYAYDAHRDMCVAYGAFRDRLKTASFWRRKLMRRQLKKFQKLTSWLNFGGLRPPPWGVDLAPAPYEPALANAFGSKLTMLMLIEQDPAKQAAEINESPALNWFLAHSEGEDASTVVYDTSDLLYRTQRDYPKFLALYKQLVR